MNKNKRIDRFWSHEASNIRCVRESDYDALAEEFNQERADHNRLKEDCWALQQKLAARVSELEGLLVNAICDYRAMGDYTAADRIQTALAGQQQQGEQERPKEQCPVTGAIHDVDHADLPAPVDERQIDEAGDWMGPPPARYDGFRPCPHCGGENIIGRPHHFVGCDDCGAKCPTPSAWQARAALAPTAVVMPERMTTIPEGKTISYAAGYEDALDAVARLNRCTLSLELLDRIARDYTGRRGWDALEPDRLDAVDELRAMLGAKD